MLFFLAKKNNVPHPPLVLHSPKKMPSQSKQNTFGSDTEVKKRLETFSCGSVKTCSFKLVVVVWRLY